MRTLNGIAIKKLFINGSNNLYNNYQEIDALNVFPVPDGDTGMNMNLTLSSGCKELKDVNDKNVYLVAKRFSRGLLMGARGNSGVITSQIFRGLAEGLKGKSEVNSVELSEAFEKGVEVAYKAVVKPVEGTILTVIRESSEALANEVNENISIEKCFDIMIKEAKESLKRTPDLLPILKEAGVIDSGGAGLIKILEGMRAALNNQVIERNNIQANNETTLSFAAAKIEEEEFGYCTEFIMELGPDSIKKDFDQEAFTKDLNEKGNSLVVVCDDNIVKVHVHTMTPGEVLTYAQQFGEFLKLKIENMTEQHHAIATNNEVQEMEHLVDDEETFEKVENAIISVSSGKGIDNLFKELGVRLIVKGGQTMNPSSEDFIAAIKKINANNVFILPNNSNIIMAANQAKDLCSELANIQVIPTKTILEGVSACAMFDASADVDANLESMLDATKAVKSGEVTFATRDTRIQGVDVKKDDFIGLFGKDLIVDCPDKTKAAMSLLDKMIDEDENSIITLLVGKDVTLEEKNSVLKYIEEKYPDFDVDVRDGGQPVYSFLIGVE